MANENVNKVVYGDETIMDITDTTAEAADVASGKVFYAKSGARTLGTASGGGGKGVYYGTCEDLSGVAAKTVACDGFVLEKGATIAVLFLDGNTSVGTKLNVNGTGAKWVKINNHLISQHHRFRFVYNTTVLFVYDGENYVPQGYDFLPSLAATASSETAANEAAKVATCGSDIDASSALYAVRFTFANTVEGELTLSVNGGNSYKIYYKGKLTSSSNPLLWGIGDTLLFSYDGGRYNCIGTPATAPGISQATDDVTGTVKTNAAESISLNADGQLTVGGRLGQFPGTTGIYASNDRDPRNVGDSSFLITDAKGMDLNTNRAFALVSGYGVTCKSAAKGSTQYRVSNTYINRLKCKMCEGGYASIDEATSKAQRIVQVVSVTINGSAFTPDSSPNSSAAAQDIVITTSESLNPTSATTSIRLFGVMKAYSSAHIGNGIASQGGGRNLLIGGGITKVGSSNDDCIVGNDIYVSGNGNAAFGRQHIMAKNRGFAAGTGHDFTNAASEGVAAFGQFASLPNTVLLAVGNGTSHTDRSNAFEVTKDGGIVLRSPNGTRYKITVNDSGNLTTAAV